MAQFRMNVNLLIEAADDAAARTKAKSILDAIPTESSILDAISTGDSVIYDAVPKDKSAPRVRVRVNKE